MLLMYQPHLRLRNFLSLPSFSTVGLHFCAISMTTGHFQWFQIENEYGAFGYEDFPRDTAYLDALKNVLRDSGIESLLFTSDSPKLTKDYGSLQGGKTFPPLFIPKVHKSFDLKNKV